MYEQQKKVVATVLKALDAKKISAEKIFLHKFIYFLSTQNIKTELHFEPYTYGPYSFDLQKTLNNMAFWNEIEDNKNSIIFKDIEKYVDSSRLTQVSDMLNKFLDALGDVSFASLEKAGTVLYCVQTLLYKKEVPSSVKVLQEFKAWKGSRYSDAEISQTFEKLQPYIPQQA